MENSYWDRKGIEQEKYDEMKDNGWEFTKRTKTIFHSYYRYFNDGDFPGWARGDWDLRKYGRWGWELNERGLEQQEFRVTEAILYEYKRYKKATA